MGDDD